MLTAEQQAVVMHQQGHARVRAVAGSGKTTTLVARVCYLLEQGIAAQRILVVMYNRAARTDFCAKLERQAPDARLRPDIRTFHSLGYKLSQTLVRWGVLAERQLVQEEWMVDQLVRQALTLLAAEQATARKKTRLQSWLEDEVLESFKAFCTRVKNGLDSAVACYQHGDFAHPQHQHFVAAFERLEQLLAETGKMFFDDLLWRPAGALRDHPQCIPRLQGFLDHIIVDEYQDINAVQQYLLAALAGQHAQVMVVGDVDQCIYEWRGARPEYMLTRFAQDFSPVTDYPLSRTFRFGHGLALMANQLIQHNRERPEQMTLASDHAPRALIEQGEGAGWLLTRWLAWQEQAAPGQHAAILVRSWAQSLAVQLAFLKAQQAFRLPRQEYFIFNRPPIQGLVAYLRLAYYGRSGMKINLQHPDVQQDFYCLFSFPTLYLSEVQRQQLVQAKITQTLDQTLASWPAVRRQRVLKRLKTLEKLRLLALKLHPAAFIKQLLDLTQAESVLQRSAANQAAAEEALRLIEGLYRYAQSSEQDLGAWIAELELARQKGQAMQAQAIQDSTPLILTVHAAKGLEWDWVGLYGLNEGDFPYISRSGRLNKQDEEAERRLFYVALTRAQRGLALATADQMTPASRFIDEAALEDARLLDRYLYACSNDPLLTKPCQVRFPDLIRDYWQRVRSSPCPKLL